VAMAMVGARVLSRAGLSMTTSACVISPVFVVSSFGWKKRVEYAAAAAAGRSIISSSPVLFSFSTALSCSSSSSAVSSVETDAVVPPQQPPAAAAAAADVASDLDLLDIRVGKILKAWKHPEADSLYVEEVDVGEAEGPRTICSGLVKYVPEEELQDRAVVVLSNLKPRNMRGVKSNGMLLAASDAAHERVELLSPPPGAMPGERIWFGSEADQANQAASATPNQVQKKKIWETIQPLLKTTDECTAVFQDRPMRVSAGIVTCKSLKGANVS
jgi:aminoacyl tRNA synthase complex-interacting multifunctional protein 1